MRNYTARFDRPSFAAFSITPDVQNDATRPNDLYVTTYRGGLSRNVFAEAQVSQKRFGFRGGGGTETAIGYSPFITLTQELGHYNAPYFDATDPEDRNNLQVTGNVTWYRGTERFGSHNVNVGFESYRSTRTGGNSQTSTGYVLPEPRRPGRRPGRPAAELRRTAVRDALPVVRRPAAERVVDDSAP